MRPLFHFLIGLAYGAMGAFLALRINGEDGVAWWLCVAACLLVLMSVIVLIADVRGPRKVVRDE
jgi:hypothetical protein